MSKELDAFVAAWRIAGPQLEALRDRELIDTPLPVAMEQLAGMVESALYLYPAVADSGLVEMQKVFARLRQ